MKLLLSIFFLFINLQANSSITICGTGDSQELLETLSFAYEKEHPNSKIIIPPSIGSGGGIKSVAFDKCDLGRIARKIKHSEEKYNLNYLLFAKSAVVIVTNQNIKNITNITTKEFINIFDGTINKWNQLDNKTNGKIYVARRESGDSSTTVLEKNIKNFKKIKKLAGKVIFTTQEKLKTMCKYKNTIGYLPYSQVVHSKLHILNFDGVKPTIKNIQENRYKLILPFGLVYKGKLNKLSQSFINFIQSKDGEDIILSHGSIPIK